MGEDVSELDFEALTLRIQGCMLCTLGGKRTMAVPGAGARDAALMFIGEGPGHYEDQQGLPFVGRAGALLNELLAGIGMSREEVFVTNMIKCRAPNNRDPLPIEITSCAPYLDRQIELVSPKLIVTLGRYSTAKFFPDQPIGKLRGVPANWRGIVVCPMYHPAAALRNSSLRAALERDFSKIPELLRSTVHASAHASAPAPAEDAAAQLGLMGSGAPTSGAPASDAPGPADQPRPARRPKQMGML